MSRRGCGLSFCCALVILFSPFISEAHSEELLTCATGSEVADFRYISTPTGIAPSPNYIQPNLVTSAISPSGLSYAISEGAGSSSTAVRILTFAFSGQKFWRTINLPFAPESIELVPVRTAQSLSSSNTSVRLMLLAQRPSTRAVYTVLLDNTGGQQQAANSFAPAPTFNPGNLGNMAIARSSGAYGVLRALLISESMLSGSAPSINEYVVGAKICDHPVWDLSLATLRCTDGNGNVRNPYFQMNGSWTYNSPHFKYNIKAYENAQGNLVLAYVNFEGKLYTYNSATGPELGIPNSLNINSFEVANSSSPEGSNYALSRSLGAAGFAELSLNPSNFANQQIFAPAWFQSTSGNFLSGQGVDSQLLDLGTDGVRAPVSAYRFTAETHYGGTLRAVLLRDHASGDLGLIADIYSLNGGSPATSFLSIQNATVTRLPDGSAVVVYTRSTSQPQLFKLLMWSVCS